jgi:thymidine kinase
MKINLEILTYIMSVYKMSSLNNAYLELIIGPMFSGKTSRLIDVYKQCKFCNIPVAVINHCIDDRYHDTMLSTHDKVMIPCLKTDNLFLVLTNSEVQDAQVVIINEGQFFSDLHDVVLQMIGLGKKIYVGGLDGDFERKKFGQILDLIPLSDKVTKLTSLCSICKDGTPGIFSKRITTETEQTVVGSDNYIPVCRNCYSTK